jgi:hypothetical protein
MIHLPPKTDAALWLTIDDKSGPNGPWKKHYILARCPDYLFRIYNKPDGTFMGNIIESANPAAEFNAKTQEKLGKGYTQTAAWDPAIQQWAAPTLLPQVVGMPARFKEDLVHKVNLKMSGSPDKFDEITLELFRTNANLYRLDQTEYWQPNPQLGFPLWQTLFSSEDAAKKILQEVVEKKMLKGYVAYHNNRVPVQKPTGLAAVYPLMPRVALAFGLTI